MDKKQKYEGKDRIELKDIKKSIDDLLLQKFALLKSFSLQIEP